MPSSPAPLTRNPAPLLIDLGTTRELLGGISTQTIYRLIADGQLELVKIRRRSFVTLSSLEALIRTGTAREARR